MRRLVLGALCGLGLVAGPVQAQEVTFTTQTLTPEPALMAAQHALESCRDRGYQVAVAVTDRAGVPLAVLLDRYAGAHTSETATRKASAAASFHMATTPLARDPQADQAASGIRHVDQVLALRGGFPIRAAGSLVAAIGVVGAPGAEADD